MALFFAKHGVDVEDIGNEILYPPPIQHNASQTDVNIGTPKWPEINAAAAKDLTLNHYTMMEDQDGNGCLRLQKAETVQAGKPEATEPRIAVASSYGAISSILLAIVSQSLGIHKDEKGAFSFQIGAQPKWNARGIDHNSISVMFDEHKHKSLLSFYLGNQGTKEREDHEFSLVPYKTKKDVGEEEEVLITPWGDKVPSLGWKECNIESYNLMAKLYTDDAPPFRHTDQAAVAVALSEILRGISEKYGELTTKGHIQQFVAKLLELSSIDPPSTGALNWECIHDLVFMAKVLWVGLELPSFAVIGGRHRLFTLCHLLLGWKATTNGSTHVCIEAKLPNTLVCYKAPVQIVVGGDKGLLRSFSLQLQDQTKHTIPVNIGNFMIDVLENCQKRSRLDDLKTGPDAMKLFWDATIHCLKSNEAYRDLTKHVQGSKSSLLDIALESSKRNKKLWNSFMKFLSKGKYLFPAPEDDEPVTTMLFFLNSTNFARMFPELTKEVTDTSLKKLESIDLYVNSIIHWTTKTLMTYYVWSVRQKRQCNTKNNGDTYVKLILDHRLCSILFLALAKWGLEIPGEGKESWIDPEPISKDSTIKSNLFRYFQRMTLLLESGRYKFDHDFDRIQVKQHKSVIANTKIKNLTGYLQMAVGELYPPKTILVIGMVTLAIPSFPFKTAKDEKSEAIFGSNLSDKELGDWARLSKLHEMSNVHAFTMSDEPKDPKHLYGFHPHRHKKSNTKDVRSLAKAAREMLRIFGFNGFDQICFDYFIGQKIDTWSSFICELAPLLNPGGALYIPHHDGDGPAGEPDADEKFRSAKLKVEHFKLGPEHWLWNATDAVPQCFLKSCRNPPIKTHFKISPVSRKANAGYTVKRLPQPTDHQGPASDKSQGSSNRKTKAKAGKSPSKPKSKEKSPSKDISLGSSNSKTKAGTNKSPPQSKDDAKAGNKNAKAGESPSKPKPQDGAKPGEKRARSPNREVDCTQKKQKGATNVSQCVWTKTDAKLVAPEHPPPYLRGVLHALWHLHGGGLFTKETLRKFQSLLLEWFKKEPNITEATRLERIREQVGRFEEFHQHSFLLPQARHPFNFVLVRPELIKGVVSHLEKHVAEKNMLWKPINIHTDESVRSGNEGLFLDSNNLLSSRSSYSMFNWGKTGSKDHDPSDDAPDEWKNRGKSLLTPETMAEIDQVALNAARLIYPDLGDRTLEDLTKVFMVHPGIVQTNKAYHQRLHYDRNKAEEGGTFYLHVPLATEGMLLRILPHRKNRSEFIFIPFGCALAIPVDLAHAGIYSYPGSKATNSRLHIIVTERPYLKYHAEKDHLVEIQEPEFQRPSAKLEDLMKPSEEQDRFSKTYLKLFENTVTDVIVYGDQGTTQGEIK